MVAVSTKAAAVETRQANIDSERTILETKRNRNRNRDQTSRMLHSHLVVETLCALLSMYRLR